MKKILLPLLFCIALLLSGCVDKTPLSEEQKSFAGKWVSNDGTWIQVFNDGGGSFELSNSSVTGGSATLTDSTIVIGLMGLDATFRIDKAPYEEDGVWKMDLDGNTYTKR